MKKVIAALCILFTFSLFVIQASATPPEMWSVGGKRAVGIIGLDEDSPVVLEKSTLTFDIQEYPTDYTDYIQGGFTPDKSRVSVKYNLYNPTDEEITVRLALPFTTTYYEYIKSDIADYSVKVNDETISPTIRHSYHYNNAEFDMEYDPGRLHDDYLSHFLITPETKVTKYTYEIECRDLINHQLAWVGTDIYGYKNTYVYLSEGGGGMDLRGGGFRLCRSIGSDTTVEVYVFGNATSFKPNWTIYENPKVSDNETLDGSVTLIKTDEMTFNNFVFNEYDESLGISEMDWYNAYMAHFENDPSERPIVSLFEYYNSTEITDWFMGWYRWDVVLAPGERASTEAGLPIFPELEIRYEPQKLKYCYNLPYPHVWYAGGEKEIRINTHLHLIETSFGEYTQTDGGYLVEPTNDVFMYEYHFTLCESESPEIQESSKGLSDVIENNSVLNVILNVILFPFKLIYMIIDKIVEWLR